MKTIRQIADEIGVSKQAVYQRLKRNADLSTRLQPFTSTVDGVVYIDVDGEKLITEAFSKKVSKQDGVNVDINKTDVDSNVDSNVYSGVDSDYLQKTLSVMQSTVTLLQEQLSSKDKQIEQLTAALTAAQNTQQELADALKAAQALHAGTIQQQLLDAQHEPENVLSEDNNTAQPGKINTEGENPPLRKWWQFWKK